MTVPSGGGGEGWAKAYRAVALVSALPIGTVAGGILGALLDRALGGGWIFTAALGLLGFSFGILQLSRGLQQSQDDEPRDHPP